jgi:hypothetical protein
MTNMFDAYREALVVETSTIWPEQYDDWDPAERARIERQLHADPQAAAQLDYTQLHTGFCRDITITSEDLDRFK